MIIFKGETKSFDILIKDISGNIGLPENFINVKVLIYDQVTGAVMAKFSKVEEPGYHPLIISENKFRFILTKEITELASDGYKIVQINMYVFDESFDDNLRILIKRGRFGTVK